MSFNADRFRAACRPFVFTAGGRAWTARPISAPALARFHDDITLIGASELERMAAASSPVARARAKQAAERNRGRLLLRLLRLAFPFRFSYCWRGDPVRALLRLPSAERGEAIKSFFLFVEGKPTLSAPPLTPAIPTTPGTPSSAPSAST
jgi:hypothetical protein